MPPPPSLPPTPLSLAILLALAPGDLYGYTLLQEIERQSGGALTPGTGTLYAALQRLQDEGFITDSPDRPAADEDQRRRYYRLTAEGRAVAVAEAARLVRVLDVARERGILPDPGAR